MKNRSWLVAIHSFSSFGKFPSIDYNRLLCIFSALACHYTYNIDTYYHVLPSKSTQHVKLHTSSHMWMEPQTTFFPVVNYVLRSVYKPQTEHTGMRYLLNIHQWICNLLLHKPDYEHWIIWPRSHCLGCKREFNTLCLKTVSCTGLNCSPIRKNTGSRCMNTAVQ